MSTRVAYSQTHTATPAATIAAVEVTEEATAEAQPVELLVPEVISVRPHDPESFLQGLVLHDGVFYESAGQYEISNVREVDPETGEVLRQAEAPDEVFAEGLALTPDDRLIQITWQEQQAFVYDRETFELLDTFEYEGEGWGLCYDDESSQLYMSDGSPILTMRDPDTFEPGREIIVTFEGQPVERLNELECVGDSIYANVWQTDFIVRIDKETGVITGVINAAGLLTPEEIEAAGSNGVLNGIAYDAENDVFYITGKLWPHLFEVRFVEFERPQS
ncbi:MAG: glutaminyl-peptide cyclotransferase [Burkholderiales bacterium]|nr:glutaminyl-peptide cyclotransferase [Anaerolineae bacterium]